MKTAIFIVLLALATTAPAADFGWTSVNTLADGTEYSVQDGRIFRLDRPGDIRSAIIRADFPRDSAQMPEDSGNWLARYWFTAEFNCAKHLIRPIHGVVAFYNAQSYTLDDPLAEWGPPIPPDTEWSVFLKYVCSTELPK